MKLSKRVITIGWLVWIAVTLGSFAVWEGLAIASGIECATLTCHVRAFVAQEWPNVFLVGGPLVWLVLHMIAIRRRKGSS